MYSSWVTHSRIGTCAPRSWKFLREATAEQVQAHVTRALEADNKLTTGHVMNRLFNPVTRQNIWGATCDERWNADGMVPRHFREISLMERTPLLDHGGNHP